MKRLWRAPGVMAGAMLLALSMIYTARQTGVNSPHFWWSLLICLVVAAMALTFRYFTDRPSVSNGRRQNNQQPYGSN
jgi:hypothetical protein